MYYRQLARITLAATIALLVTIFFAYQAFLTWPASDQPTQQVQSGSTTIPLRPIPPDNQPTSVFRYLYEDNEFVQLFYAAQLPNLEELDTPLSITGNAAVDTHMIALAEKRGYRLQRQPIAPLGVIESVRLQQPAIDAWKQLTTAAQQDGITFNIVSGYRSIADQRTLFLTRFRDASLRAIGREYTSAEIVAGNADATIDTVLQYSSIPGFSKHHTGYALDIHDANARTDFTLFANTPAYAWISKDNFANAKRFGFIPSYPEEATNVGPEPEAWEFVWIGTEIFTAYQNLP